MPRKADQLRKTMIEPFPTGAPGSVMITMGNTRVLCTASLSQEVPPFLIDKATGQATQGWVTAEYAMLPGSTPQRKKRGPDSRGTEIQRLIGRCLRAAVDPRNMPGITVAIDCDVVCADGGTRTAAITGGFVALALTLSHARRKGLIDADPIVSPIAAVSVGIVDGKPHLDLDYPLDVRAEVDCNVAMNHKGQFVEVQGTGEQGLFTRAQLETLLDLAAKGIRQLFAVQRKALQR